MNDFKWLPKKTAYNESAVQYVVSAIRTALLEKRLNPGDKLPTEEELVAAFGVSRGTIREAMKILSAYGIVEIFQGKGSFISNNHDGVSLDAIMFRFAILQPDENERWEFREMLEKRITEDAIRYATQEDILHLEQNLAEMEARRNDAKATAELDLQFHNLLADIEPNSMIRSVYLVAIRFLEHYFYINHALPHHCEKTIKVHRETLKKIQNRDSANVEDIMAIMRDAYVTGIDRG